MSITFSMSSQLWIHINMDEIKKFIIANAITKNIIEYDYIGLCDKLDKLKMKD